MRKIALIKKTSYLLFLLLSYLLLCNMTNAQAASRAQKAKNAYAKYLQSVCSNDLFCLIDINRDKTPELLTAGNESDPIGTFRCVYTFANGKIKKLANTKKKGSVISYGEKEVKYHSRKKILAIYDGGTSNNTSFYSIKGNGKLKKVGEMGYHWYDDESTVRRPWYNGKWISEEKYNRILKQFKTLKFHRNTNKNRKKYLSNITSKGVKLFNVNGKVDTIDMKITSVKRTNQGLILTGRAKCPVDVVRTKKQQKQLKKGKIKALGKTWIVKKKYDESTCTTSYYLYRSKSAKKWSYKLYSSTYILKHPNFDLVNTKGKTVYRSVGKISVCVREDEYCELMNESGHDAFCATNKWKHKKVSLELKRSSVLKWIW